MVPNPLATFPIVCVPQLVPPQHYAVHPHHRNQTPHKSQWTVAPNTEFGVFTYGATTLGGYGQAELYGLMMENGRPAWLGVSEDGDDVLVAKFTKDQVEWHGYPYLHTRPKQSVPRNVLEIWHAQGLLSKRIYRRILGKQPC